jgi:hypothetical protein
MKALVLLAAALMIALGLTGVFWPEGLIGLAKYSFTSTGLYVIGAIRIVLGAFLFMGATTARTPNALRVIGAIIFIAGIATVLISHDQAQRLSDWWLAKGADAFRIAACLPLAAGLFIGGSTLAKGRSK